MAETTGITWADATFNPVRGCTKISPGCANCYAETFSHRNPAVLGEWGPNGRRVVAVESAWRDPVKWAKKHLARVLAGEVEPRPFRIFCASLADIFEDHPVVLSVRERLWHETIPALDKIRLPDGRPAAVLLLLTKRAEIARAWYDAHGCPDVVWPGVTVEDQKHADERIPVMLGLPRLWLSCEPLLSAVDLTPWLRERWVPCAPEDADFPTPHSPTGWARFGNRIAWVVCGGESGAKARPMHPAWAWSLRDQCVEAGVKFLFKQWGEFAPGEEIEANGTDHTGMYEDDPIDGGVPKHYFRDAPIRETARRLGKGEIPHNVGGDTVVLRVGKKAAGRLLDGRAWDEVPE